MKLDFKFTDTIKANSIEHLKAGIIVIIDVKPFGIKHFIRLADNANTHFEGMIADLKNGEVCHWSRLCLGSDEVKISANEFY